MSQINGTQRRAGYLTLMGATTVFMINTPFWLTFIPASSRGPFSRLPIETTVENILYTCDKMPPQTVLPVRSPGSIRCIIIIALLDNAAISAVWRKSTMNDTTQNRVSMAAINGDDEIYDFPHFTTR